MPDEQSNEDVPAIIPEEVYADEQSNEDVPVIIPKEDAPDENGESSVSNTPSDEAVQKLLEKEKQNTQDCEDKLKHVLADFQNLSRKTQSDIENGVNAKIVEFMIEFLKIYDDLERAKQMLFEQNIDEGLDSILKNMNSLLAKYDVKPIDALGEIFDPNLHEAISITCDPELDEDTITKEIRKGYISHNRVIRPTLVEISKQNEGELE